MATAATWDLIVIGGGAAGLTSAIMAGELGAKVLLVDKDRLGGDCTWSGCVPSKALIQSAAVAKTVSDAKRFGVECGTATVNFETAIGRVHAVQQEIASGETTEVLARHHVEVAFGGGQFIDANTVRIGPDRIERATKFLIATGSRASRPPIPGVNGARVLTNSTLFLLDKQPASLAIIGGGPIGCEMAQAFSRLGTRVTLLQRGAQLLPNEEADVAQLVTDALRTDGVDVRLNAGVKAVSDAGDNKTLELDGDAPVEAEFVLIAAGRTPNATDLGLEAAKVSTERGAIVVDDHLRTSARHIYAAGDCTGGPMFTHWAEHEARIATRNILFRGSETRALEHIPWVTFTAPEVARVGPTFDEAKAAHPSARTVSVPHTVVDRAVCAGDPIGFTRVIVDDRDHVLGAVIVGPHAGEQLSEWMLAIRCGLTLSQIGEVVHAYPTYNRANRRIADAAFFDAGIAGWKKSLFGTFKGRER